MKIQLIAVAASTFLLAACGEGAAPDAPSGTSSPATTTLTGRPIVALGLTERQLLDADLVDASGRDLGDVEGIVRDADGKPVALLVEIENTRPDRYVEVPLEGLTAVRDRTDWDIQSSLTRDDLLQLPAANPPRRVLG